MRSDPMRPLRRAARPLAALVPICVLLSGLPTPARAQIAEAWLLATPLDAGAAPRSPRAAALGSMSVALEDEETRVNLFDFTDNPAAFLADRDTSSVEQFADYDDTQDRYYGLKHSAVLRRGAVRAALRVPGEWALGLDGMMGGVQANRHDLFPSPDGSRFIRDFDLPILSTLTPALGDRTFGAQVEAPRARITYARSIWKRGTFGLRASYGHESEDRRVATPYPVDHTSRSGGIAGGALVDLNVGEVALTLGSFGHYSTDKVIGRSQTPLNDDRYDWWRPQLGFGGHLAVRVGEGVRGILDGRHRSYDGEEIASVNWAPAFFLNPLPSENDPNNVFKKKWTAFLGGYRRNEASTRWMVEIPRSPARIGWAYRYYREYEWIRTNPSVLSAARDMDVRRLGYEGGAGASIDLPDGTGLVAIEMHYARAHRVDYTRALPDMAAERLSYHFGSEYRARPWLPLRAGVVLLRELPDRRSGAAHVKGVRLTAGTGYFWKWLGTQFDAAWAHQHSRYAPADPSGEVSYGDSFSFAARHLF